MDEIQKKQSTNNIEYMSKNNYDKALEFYGLAGKTPIQVSKRFNFYPVTKITNKKVGTTKVTKVSQNNPNFSRRVEEYLINKWKGDSQEYYGIYNMLYKRYDKKTKKMKDAVIKITAKGTKDSVILDALAKYNKRVQQYKEDYPENNSYYLNYEPVSLIPIPNTTYSNIIVENQRVESSVLGGQRTIGKKGIKRNMLMKDALTFFKISDDIQEWDTKQGKCVFDYLIWKYKDVSGFKKVLGKSREQAEDWLNNLFIGNEPEELNPLQQGVSTQQLEKFCDFFNVNMYAYDKGDKLIEYYKCKNSIDNKKVNMALIFVVYDEHFYPVEDKTERKSKQGRATATGIKIASNDIEEFESTKDIDKKKVIAPTEEEFKLLKGDNIDYISIQNKWALKYFKNNDGRIPFPIDAKNIYIKDATIESIIYDDKIVLTKPVNQYIKKFFDDNTDLGYQGQSSLSVTNYIWEQMYPFKFKKSPFLSQPNQQVADALSVEKVKWRTHLGRINDNYTPDDIKDMIQNGKAIVADITKCYCDAIYNQREKFIVFKGKEIVEEYDGKPLNLGLYFVDTDDMTLFHQSNWYSKTIIELAIKEHIDFKILRQIRCVDEDWCWSKVISTEKDIPITLSNDNLFKNWCDKVIELTEQDGDFTLTKDVINSITGYLGKTFRKTKEVGLSKKLNELWTDWLVPEVQDNPNLNIYLNTIENDGDNVYLYGVEKMTNNLSNGLPMYIQLLDWSNIALYNLGKDIGGEIIYRKTDCIVSIGGKIPEDKLEPDVCYYSDRFGKYHLEDIEKALHFNYELVMNTNRKVEIPVLDDDWIDYKQFNSSDDWEAILKTAIEKGGMLATGPAGTGKSYIIGKGIEAKLLPEDNEARLAFTNRAARNIKGTTIHKAMALNRDGNTNSKSLEHLKKIPIFVIDEISMINSWLWNKLMVLKKNTGAIFILLGDYRQCPPIEDGKEIDYFTHPYVKQLVNYNRCELTKPQRYDMKLWKWLEDFYEGGYEGDDICKKKLSIENILYRKNICYCNKTRRNINNLCMDYFKKTKAFVALSVPEKCKNEYADTALIYKELPVMAIANNKDLEIINTEEFLVKEFSSSESNIKLYRDEDPDGEELIVEFNDFHKYFVVNYASTTHKSQGATITKEINIFDWFYMMDDRRIGYTAVSRAKSCEQVTICSKIVK